MTGMPSRRDEAETAFAWVRYVAELQKIQSEHDGICPYCRRCFGWTCGIPTKDHVIPRSRGGSFLQGNCLIVCCGCNQDKANMTLQDWSLRLFIAEDERYSIVVALCARLYPAAPPHNTDRPGGLR